MKQTFFQFKILGHNVNLYFFQFKHAPRITDKWGMLGKPCE